MQFAHSSEKRGWWGGGGGGGGTFSSLAEGTLGRIHAAAGFKKVATDRAGSIPHDLGGFNNCV